MESLLILLFAGIILLASAAIVAALFDLRAERIAQEALVRQLGFATQTVPQPDVMRLFSMGSQELEWNNALRLSHSDYTLYLPNLQRKGGDGNAREGKDSLVLVDSRLNLPEFIIWVLDPRWEEAGGKLKDWSMASLHRLFAAAGLHPVRLTLPELNERYLCFAPNPEQVQAFLNQRQIEAILGSGIQTMRAANQALGISFNPLLGGRSTWLKVEDVQRLTMTALALRKELIPEEARRTGPELSLAPSSMTAAPPAATIARGVDVHSRLSDNSYTPVKCPKCGASNGAGSTTCAFCSSPLSPAGGGTRQAPAAKPAMPFSIPELPKAAQLSSLAGRFIFGLSFFSIAVLFLFLFGTSVELRCERQTNREIDCLRTTKFYSLPINRYHFTNPTSVRIDESCDDGCTYEVQLESDQGWVGMYGFYSSGYEDKEESAQRIAQFLGDSAEQTLLLRQTNWIVMLVLSVFMLVGLVALATATGQALSAYLSSRSS